MFWYYSGYWLLAPDSLEIYLQSIVSQPNMLRQFAGDLRMFQLMAARHIFGVRRMSDRSGSLAHRVAGLFLQGIRA